MKQLVQWLDFHLTLLGASIVHLLSLSTTAWSALLRLASRTDCHVELSDLVSILAWCWHLDWTGPVEVEVAQRVRQLLDVRLGEARLVKRNMEVSGQDATLIGRSRSHEEIIGSAFTLVSTALDESLVDDATIGWVHQATILVFDKEALCDPLVHDDKIDRRLCFCLVVELVDCLLELGNLLGEADITLSVTKSISVDHKVGWELPFVLRSKDFDGFLDCILHRSLDDLLSLLLHQVL